MKTYPKLSIVVCTKNEENRINQCLSRILENDFDELIIVDGNSIDKTVEIAKNFTNKIIISNSGGITADRQKGINAAKNEYIAMIDSDHYLEKHSLNKLMDDLIKFNFDIVQSQLKSFGDGFWNLAEEETWDIAHNSSGLKKMIGTAPAIYKKKIFLDIQFDDTVTKKIDDTDFIYRLYSNTKYKFGIGKTKIFQFHNPLLKDYISKFIWYGYGDGEFVNKYPYKFGSILYHQLIRYVLIYPLKAIYYYKFKGALFFILQGLIRFYGLIRYFFIKK
tara:strand:+ start:969 stop:1796 length:828 start_codon:yes stop_codon:yes gene_type:complete